MALRVGGWDLGSGCVNGLAGGWMDKSVGEQVIDWMMEKVGEYLGGEMDEWVLDWFYAIQNKLRTNCSQTRQRQSFELNDLKF